VRAEVRAKTLAPRRDLEVCSTTLITPQVVKKKRDFQNRMCIWAFLALRYADGHREGGQVLNSDPLKYGIAGPRGESRIERMRARKDAATAASRWGFSPSLPFSLTAMYPQTSLFPVRYVASRMRSTIPTAALRVPSAGARARLSGQHTSTWFLTLGKAISMGFLGVVRAYIHIPPFPFALAHYAGPSLRLSCGRPGEDSGVNSLRHDHH
jgi:hypothetical protein